MPEKSLAELAALAGASVAGDGSALIYGAAPIETAGPGQICFVADKRLLPLLRTTRASAAVVAPGTVGGPSGPALLIAANPLLAFALIADALSPLELPAPGVHPKAEVHPEARLGEGVSVQPFCVVEQGASVGSGTVLFPGVYVGKDANIGPGCVLYSGVAVREGCSVGARVIIHCNSVVGSDGFGYARDGARYVKVPQKGAVRIEDDVEIGACVTIDRATMGQTVIGAGTKVDNLVQVAHNVKVGQDTVLVAQSGIAGSASVGSRVQIGGQVGVIGHIKIGDGAAIGAKSGVVHDVPDKAMFSGIPAIPHGDWLRAQSLYARLPELKKRIEELEARLEGLESALKKKQ